MNKKYQTASVYCLIDPRNNTPFYVGVTVHPLFKRLDQHVREAKLNTDKKQRAVIIMQILKAGKHPQIQLVEEVTIKERMAAEKRHILIFKESGFEICNSKASIYEAKKHVIDGCFDISKFKKTA